MPWEDPEDGQPRGGWGARRRRRSGGPPDPLHRVWFHPSELAGLLAADDGPHTTTPIAHHGAPLAAGVFLAAASALAVMLTVLGASTGTNTGGTRLFASVSFPTETTQALTVLAVSAGMNVVTILTTDAGDELRRVGTGIPIGGGEVVTCTDVLDGTTTLKVLTSGGRELDAVVVGIDPATDLAVLRVKGTLPAARMGSSKNLHRGDSVVTITAGVNSRSGVSAGLVGVLETTVMATNRMASSTREASLVGLIETNDPPAHAAGAALLDRKGAVIGILTETREGNGFALPIEVVRNVVDQLTATGAVHRAWLGITSDDENGAVRVRHVTAGSPASRAGVAEGDLVIKAADASIHTVGDLMAVLQRQRPGDPFRMTLVRGTERIRVQARLAAADAATSAVTAGFVSG